MNWYKESQERPYASGAFDTDQEFYQEVQQLIKDMTSMTNLPIATSIPEHMSRDYQRAFHINTILSRMLHPFTAARFLKKTSADMNEVKNLFYIMKDLMANLVHRLPEIVARDMNSGQIVDPLGSTKVVLEEPSTMSKMSIADLIQQIRNIEKKIAEGSTGRNTMNLVELLLANDVGYQWDDKNEDDLKGLLDEASGETYNMTHSELLKQEDDFMKDLHVDALMNDSEISNFDNGSVLIQNIREDKKDPS